MTTLLLLIVAAVLFLAYSNGANDNFKGVATLFGSGTCSYRAALIWATITTAAGSLLAIQLAQGLIETFKGKGLVPDSLTTQPVFALSVSFGAALTVILATRFQLQPEGSLTLVSTGMIVLAWVTTLPLAAALSARSYWLASML